MPIPDYQTLMLPVLRVASGGLDCSVRECRELLAEEFRLNEEERVALLPSGRQPIFDNRVAWAKTYLQRAGLLESTGRGRFRITDRGRQTLQEKPERIDVKYLEQFPEFVEFRSAVRKEEGAEDVRDATEAETPEEMLEEAYHRLRADLAEELLARVKRSVPSFFEQLVVDLLVKMGYGASQAAAGRALGKSGDEGIDGVIDEDRLGLDSVYIQAKRWEGTVGRPELQKFVGALHGKHARKGVFITTGGFSTEAVQYIGSIEPRVRLIDGKELTQFMIDYGLGVAPVRTYEIKRIDSDYFPED